MADRGGRAGPVDAVVVAAMPEELLPLRRMLSDPHPIDGTGRMIRGWLSGRRVLLATTGDGARNAAAGTAEALSATDAGILIGIGVAGALTGDLRGGDLVSAARVLGEGTGVSLTASPRALGAAPPGARPAIAVSANRIADTATDRRRLLALARPAAGVGAIVDLESLAFAEGAAAARMPWLILRAISDTEEEALPDILNAALDAGGSVGRWRVLAGLLDQPFALPALLRLRRRVRACAVTLAAGVRATLGRLDAVI